MIKSITTVVFLLLSFLAVKKHVLQASTLNGASMAPTMHSGDVVMVDKITHLVIDLQRGELVTAWHNGKTVVKRIVGLPEDVIVVMDGFLLRNGEVIDESYVTNYGGSAGKRTIVPDGYVYLLGDNRSGSEDSRTYGPVKISGRVLFTYWPLQRVEVRPVVKYILETSWNWLWYY